MAGLSAERREERRREYAVSPLPLRRRGRVLVVEGFASSLRVERGRLIVRSGSGRQAREQAFPRTAGLARVVVVGRAGSVSLAALGWLADLGIGLLVLDRDGRPLALSGALGVEDARLRRAQALAPASPVGLALARSLLASKLDGQLEVAAELPERETAQAAQEGLAGALPALAQAGSLEELRLVEAQAAKAYWQAWSAVPLAFAPRDRHRVPEAWRRFGGRSSPLSGSPRLATSPGNALLNYLYALAEQEAALALRAVGLDPGLGLLHRDQPARASLALDLLEAVRPAIDRYLLRLVGEHVFAASDFYETRRGSVRLLAPLTHRLAETLPAWGERLSPLAERVAESLLSGRPTPLTQARRSAGRDPYRRSPRRASPTAPPRPASCRRCGVLLARPGTLYCQGCFPEYERERVAAFSAAGPAALARLRAEGADPTATPQARAKIGQAVAKRRREAREWERSHPRPDPDRFRREILPAIQALPLSRLMEASGLSLRYVSQIRRGQRVPHPRHWPALLAAAGTASASDPSHPSSG